MDVAGIVPEASEEGLAEMSFWYYKKEKDGKKSLVAFDIPFFLIITILGFLFLLVGPRHFGKPFQIVTDAFYFIAFGFLLLLISKVSLFVKEIWVSWGYSQMTRFFKILYILGYVLIGIGMFQILIIYKIGRF